MMKWLRAHTKQIMVVTVLLAMFSFIGGSALTQILAPSEEREAAIKAFGHEYTVGDIRVSQRDADVLKTLGINWQYDADQRMSIETWHVLHEEAVRAGLVVSESEIDEELNRMQQSVGANGINLLEVLRVQYKITPTVAREALRKHLTIMKNAEHLASAATPSENQIRHYIRDTEDKVKVQFVALDAEKFVDPNLPLSAEQVQAQFDKYKDVEANPEAGVIGYKLPRRVKLQYVVADFKKIEPGINVSFEEVKTFWRANKSKYRKLVYETPEPTSQPTSGPTSQPAAVPKSVEKTIAEARPDVETELRKTNSQKVSGQVMAKLANTLQKPWLDEKTDKDTGYKTIPAAAKEPNFLKDAVEKAAKEGGIFLEYKETGFVSAADIDKNDDLKHAILTGEGTGGLKISEYAFRVPLFHKNEPGAEATATCLQMFQCPDSPLIYSQYAQFFSSRMSPPVEKLVLFRVVEASEAHAPATVDEVRAAVERDLRIEAAMKALEPAVAELCAAARRIGLKDALTLFDDLKKKQSELTVMGPPAFARSVSVMSQDLRKLLTEGKPTLVAPNVSGLGTSQAFVDACLEMAAEGWKPSDAMPTAGDKLKLATTRPASTPEPVVRTVALAGMGKWCVVEKLGTERVDTAKYETTLRQNGMSRLMGERGAALLTHWFKPPNVEKRTGFERIVRVPTGPATGEQVSTPKDEHPLLGFQ